MDIVAIVNVVTGVISAAITVVLCLFGWWKWNDKKLTDIWTRVNNDKDDNKKSSEIIRSEVYAKVSRNEAQTARVSAELQEFKVKVADEYMRQTDFDKALDRHFNQLYLRMTKMEEKLERYIELRLKG